jgi:small subunit ribosomal protein S18
MRPPNSQSGSRPFRKGGARKPFIKRKSCRFCADKISVDYKLPNMLKAFVTERGKILSRRFTGTCAGHQRKLTQAIKRARMLAMLSFTTVKY